MQNERPSTTHFGYQEISTAKKTERVGEVFDSVASRYDLMNDLMSFGLQRYWKRLAVTRAQIQSHHQVLDLAGGTGDLTALIANKLDKQQGQVILADINNAMLSRGRARLIDAGIVKKGRICASQCRNFAFSGSAFSLHYHGIWIT